MRIIDEKPSKSVVKRKICGNCGVKLEYVPNDVKSRHGTDISGGPDGAEWIVCPKCDNEIILRTW